MSQQPLFPENNVQTKNTDTQENKAVGVDKEDPLVNEVQIGVIGGDKDRQSVEHVREVGESQVFTRLRNSPEIISIMGAIVDDIMGEGVEYRYVGRTDGAENPGKRKKQDAKEFWRNNQEEFANSLMDSMAMGDGYLFKRSPDKEEAKAQVKSYIEDNYSFNFEENKDVAAQHVLKNFDEDLETAKQLQMVPASTMEHIITEHGDVQRFKQEVGGDEVFFDPDKIVHHSFMELNGKTYGWTPFISLFAELDLLANAKDYNGVYFNNAAVPSKVFKLASEGPNGQNFEMIKKTLKRYREMENKHRDLVLTGDVEIDDLNSNVGDMNFRELAEYVTRVIVMAWGVPPTRIGLPMEGTGARVTNLTHEGYFKRISRLQRKYANLLNREVFEPMFDVRIEFKNPDIKTEIRKAERDLRQTEVVRQRASLGLMNKGAAMEYLGLNKDQVSEIGDEEFVQAAQGGDSSLNSMTDNTSINRDNAEEAVQADNRESQIEENV